MKPSKIISTILVTSALFIALTGCGKKEGPAEQAGKEVDEAVEKVGEKIEEAGKRVQDAAKGDD